MLLKSLRLKINLKVGKFMNNISSTNINDWPIWKWAVLIKRFNNKSSKEICNYYYSIKPCIKRITKMKLEKSRKLPPVNLTRREKQILYHYYIDQSPPKYIAEGIGTSYSSIISSRLRALKKINLFLDFFDLYQSKKIAQQEGGLK